MPKKISKKDSISFEKHLKNAKNIVQKLESSDCTLDEMLILYENGIKSLKFCNQKLTEFEDKINIIKTDIKNKINPDNSE